MTMCTTEAAFAVWGALGGITVLGVAVLLGAMIDTWRTRRAISREYDKPGDRQ